MLAGQKKVIVVRDERWWHDATGVLSAKITLSLALSPQGRGNQQRPWFDELTTNGVVKGYVAIAGDVGYPAISLLAHRIPPPLPAPHPGTNG